MKKQQGSASVIVIIILVLIAALVSFYFYNNRVRSFEDLSLVNRYTVLSDKSLWEAKKIKSTGPDNWEIVDKEIAIKSKGYDGNFYCGEVAAQFHKYNSYVNPKSMGAWSSTSIVDCGEYYFVFTYGDNGPHLYGSFEKQ